VNKPSIPVMIAGRKPIPCSNLLKKSMTSPYQL
jgi:hypothetical protein